MVPNVRALLIAIGAALVVHTGIVHGGGQVAWMTDYDAAKQKSKSTGKILLVNIHAEWCGPCKKLLAGTLTDPGLVDEINQNCIPLSLDADRDDHVVRQWQITAYPTQLFIAPDGRILQTIVGNVSVAMYRSGLQHAMQALGTSIASNAKSPPPTPANPRTAAPAEVAHRPPAATTTANAKAGAELAQFTSSPPPAAPAGVLPPVNVDPSRRVVAQPTLPTPALAANQPKIDKDLRPCDMAVPLALNGFCPVSMIRNAELVAGHQELCCVYKEKRYQFRSEAEMDLFLKSPKKYLPSEEGFCVVTWAEDHRRQAGNIEFPALFGDYLYLFANDAARQRFLRDPERYVDDSGRAHRIPLQSFRGDASTVR